MGSKKGKSYYLSKNVDLNSLKIGHFKDHLKKVADPYEIDTA